MNKVHSFLLFFLVIGLLVFQACSTTRVATEKNLPQKNAGFLLAQLQKNQFNYDWLQGKMTVEAKIKDKKNALKASFRMRKDSAIWVSISPALGIEVARILLTADSIKFLNKWNDTYFIETYDKIDQLVNYPLDFFTLQELLLGNPAGIKAENKYKSSTEGPLYVLTAKHNRKLNRALKSPNKTDVEVIALDSNIVFTADEKKLEKALSESGKDPLLEQYWINSTHYKVQKYQVSDLLNKRFLAVNYANHKKVEEQLLPHKYHLLASDQEGSISIDVTLSQVKKGQPKSFPFKIPEKYEPME